ncbi:MAG: hypothetical protein WBB28_01475 [Crinalium sp.]
MAERGCGRRKAGGVYLECQLSPYGLPIEHFIVDPPHLIEEAWRLSAKGVRLIERPRGNSSVHHVIDWVGAQYYPNVADFIEEVKRLGLSRRVPKNLDFSKLSSASRLLLVHHKAWIDGIENYFPKWECPKEINFHRPSILLKQSSPRMCAGLWWHDLVGGKFINTDDEGNSVDELDTLIAAILPDSSRLEKLKVLRKMPSFEYYGYAQPFKDKSAYRPAIFASFPCTRIAVVKGEDAEATMERVGEANIPSELVEE